MASEKEIVSSYVEFASADAFAPSIERLVQAIEAQGMTVFARIDHAAGARHVGMVMPPTVVLIYGNPRGGTPLMLAAPQAALDLPLRILIREDSDGRVLIAFHPVAAALRDVSVPTEFVARLEAAQTALIELVRSRAS
jgi:uncharacterized protein (DUF302 family)